MPSFLKSRFEMQFQAEVGMLFQRDYFAIRDGVEETSLKKKTREKKEEKQARMKSVLRRGEGLWNNCLT